VGVDERENTTNIPSLFAHGASTSLVEEEAASEDKKRGPDEEAIKKAKEKAKSTVKTRINRPRLPAV
jgi:hypothetical protein